MSYRRSIVALALVGIASLIASTAYVFASPRADVWKGTLMLYNGSDGFCSGTLIAPDLILTAAHCADKGDATNVRVQTLDELENVLSEKIVYVKAVRTLTEWDVALFSPKDPSINFVQAFGDSVAVIDVASDDEAKAVQRGDDVVAFGYPKAFQLQMTRGTYSGTKVLKPSIWEKHQLLEMSTPITGGNSGGGLYLTLPDGSVKLFGVNVAGFRDVSFMNYATTHEAVMAVTKGFVTAEYKERAGKDMPGGWIDRK
jgi:V8-like Glu-specific endopeptidase